MRRRASLAAFAVLAEVVAGERRGAAAVQVDSTLQESVFDQAGLDSPNLTIGDGPARLLVVAVATGNPAAVVRHITWSGAALTRLDARVLAAPDLRRGQQIVACIVANRTDGEVTTLGVRQFCATRLAAHKIPRTIIFLDAIPVTARGKTDRAALDDLVRARIGA